MKLSLTFSGRSKSYLKKERKLKKEICCVKTQYENTEESERSGLCVRWVAVQ